jgi:hypothetical protein
VSDFLQPSLRPEQMFPPKTAFMARTSLARTRLLGYQPVHQDAVTTTLAGLLGGMATVRHKSGATPEILAAYAKAGLKVTEDLYAYDSGDEADAHADRLIAQGYRLMFPYPLAEGRFPESGLLVGTALWERLNAKDSLADLVPAEHLPKRQVMSLAAAMEHRPLGPIWLKAAGAQPTGWGFAVRACKDQAAYDQGLADLAALPGVSSVILEEDVPVTHCWCASIGVIDHAVHFAGWAEQEFASPGRQSGSVINPLAAFPAAAQALVLALGEKARLLGYRGFAGFDVGQTAEGRLVVFDPNFRFNSSTPLAMFHAAMVARSGLPAARGFHLTQSAPMGRLIEATRQATDEGWFLPHRFLDGALLPAAAGNSYVTGMVMGEDLADTVARAARLTDILRAC